MWECGLKRIGIFLFRNAHNVTPYVGVWIETIVVNTLIGCIDVTPYVGVWIETMLAVYVTVGSDKSLLMWECGLKHSPSI